MLVEEHADGPKYIVDGTSFQPTVTKNGKGDYSVSLEKEQFSFQLKGGEIHDEAGPLDVRVNRAKPELVRAGGKGRKADGRIKPPMPGKVVELNVTVGDDVQEGTPLLVLEAMKMQNDLKSPLFGVVKTIHVAPGQNVDAATIMIEIEPHPEPETA